MRKLHKTLVKLKKKYWRYTTTPRQKKYLKRLMKRYKNAIIRLRLSHREGVDYAYGWIPAEYLKEQNKDFVCMYLSSDKAKRINRSQAIHYSENDIDIVLVWEDGSGAATEGRQKGREDAKEAERLRKHIWAPDDAIIYFAVDEDLMGPVVRAYFDGVYDVLGDRAGVYGGYQIVKYFAANKKIKWYWQTYAWSMNWETNVREWEKKAQLKQILITLPGNELFIHGTPVDYCISTKIDFGQWRVDPSKLNV